MLFERDADGKAIIRIKQLYVDTELGFYGRGFTGTAIAGETTMLDYTLVNDAHIDAVDMYIKNQAWGDYVCFKIVAPGDVEINSFGGPWYLDTSRERQQQINPPQISGLIPAGITLRIEYISTGVTDVEFKCNFRLQEPIT